MSDQRTLQQLEQLQQWNRRLRQTLIGVMVLLEQIERNRNMPSGIETLRQYTKAAGEIRRALNETGVKP